MQQHSSSQCLTQEVLDNDLGSCCVGKDIAKGVVLARNNSIDVTHCGGSGFNWSMLVFQGV